jgi:hypothetical protein
MSTDLQSPNEGRIIPYYKNLSTILALICKGLPQIFTGLDVWVSPKVLVLTILQVKYEPYYCTVLAYRIKDCEK